MRYRGIVLAAGNRVEVGFGCFAVVVERKTVGCGYFPQHGLHRSNLTGVRQAELHHSEGAFARSTRSQAQNYPNDRKPRSHGANVRGTTAIRNVSYPPIADITHP